jgi:hypothetical protein
MYDAADASTTLLADDKQAEPDRGRSLRTSSIWLHDIGARPSAKPIIVYVCVCVPDRIDHLDRHTMQV